MFNKIPFIRLLTLSLVFGTGVGAGAPGDEARLPRVPLPKIREVPASEDNRMAPFYDDIRIRHLEMLPEEIKRHHETMFTRPLPGYVTGLHGLRMVLPEDDEEAGQGSDGHWVFFVPEDRHNDFRRYLFDELGVPPAAMARGFATEFGHSVPVKGHLEALEVGLDELDGRPDLIYYLRCRQAWQAANGGLRFLSSTLAPQADFRAFLDLGSPTLYFENHSHERSLLCMTVNFETGAVVVRERFLYQHVPQRQKDVSD